MCKRNNKSVNNTSAPKRKDNVLDIVIQWVRKLWYAVLIGVSTIYVFSNFEEIVDFQFFENFNGKNLIFLVWLVLLIIPLFDSFEGFGISIKRYNLQKEDQQLNALADNKEIPTQEELEKQVRDEAE